MPLGEGLFYGGKKDVGIFDEYLFENHYERFSILAEAIKRCFNPKMVLDVGCARGYLVKAFQEVGIEAYGVDISGYAISIAPPDIRSKLYKVDLNKEILPFKNEYFDFITFIGTIQYLNNHKHAIQEIKRVFRGGGKGMIFLAKTRIKPIRGEEIKSINTHSRNYWINEFGSHGFRFMPKKLIDFTINEFLSCAFDVQNKNSLKFKIGRKIYQKGGHIGRIIVYLIHKISNLSYDRNYGEFLFVKEGRTKP